MERNGKKRKMEKRRCKHEKRKRRSERDRKPQVTTEKFYDDNIAPLVKDMARLAEEYNFEFVLQGKVCNNNNDLIAINTVIPLKTKGKCIRPKTFIQHTVGSIRVNEIPYVGVTQPVDLYDHLMDACECAADDDAEPNMLTVMGHWNGIFQPHNDCAMQWQSKRNGWTDLIPKYKHRLEILKTILCIYQFCQVRGIVLGMTLRPNAAQRAILLDHGRHWSTLLHINDLRVVKYDEELEEEDNDEQEQKIS